MRFSNPSYLLLLIPIVAGLALSFRHVRGMMRWRKRVSFGIRLLLLLAVVIALSGPEAHRQNHGLCTIFVLDRSDSISEADSAKAKELIQASLKSLSSGDKAGLIVFGKEPMVDRVPGEWRDLGSAQTIVRADSTDIGAAIRLACASFPEGMGRRIVLLSDGNETSGDAAGAAMAAAADGIEIDHLALGLSPREGEVSIADLSVPSETRVDQPFDVRVVIDSTKDTKGTLDLFRDGQNVSSQAVRLNAGRNAIVVGQSLVKAGFFQYQATIRADGDMDNRNNVGMGFVSVLGRPKVLVLQQKQSPSPLASALEQQGIITEVYGPSGIPVRPEQLQKYDAVIFNDINAASMTTGQMELVKKAVKESGVGFAMVGGEDSFLPGGYYGTPIAEALPVDLNIRQRKTFPSTSVLIVCDTSGSMSMQEDGIPKVRLAAKAAEQTVLMLSPMDRIGVAGSTDAIGFVAPIQKLTDKQNVIDQIRKLSTGGGGIYIRPSMEFARENLAKENSKVRHLILMADGSDCDEREGSFEIAAQMRKSKTTISVISIGDGEFVPFLKQLAAIGGGRFYLAAKASQLPAIFTQDAAIMSRSAIQEGAFLPKVSVGEEALKGIDPRTIPPLLAYCLADTRPLSQVGMRTNRDDVLLATWQYGLGSSLAFTSDAQARWASRWVSWDQFGRFWAQAVRAISRRATRNSYEVATTREGGKAVVEVRSQDSDGNPSERLPAEVRVSIPRADSALVSMSQTAPGVFKGSFPASEIGSYIVTLAEDDPSGGKRVNATGFSVPYPPEYRDFAANTPLLVRMSQATGGKAISDPRQTARPVTHPGSSVQELWSWFALAAAILLPVDVASRRIALPIAEALAIALAWLRARRKQAAQPVAQVANLERLHKVRGTPKSQAVAPKASETPISPEQPVVAPKADASEGSAADRLLAAKRKRQG